MNILQINTLDSRGGAAKVAYSIKQELEKRGHETSMFVARKYSQDKNIKIINDSSRFTSKVRKKLSYWLANDLDLFSSDQILKTEEFRKADIIHCHNIHSYYFNLSTLKKISELKPIVWTFHDMWPITAHCAHSFNGKIKDSGFFACPSLDIYPPIAWHNEKYLENRKNSIYEKSNFHIVTPSKWLADKVGQSILSSKPISVIHNGIDTNLYKPLPQKEARINLNLPLDKKIVLSIIKSEKDQWKGWPFANTLIEQFKDRKDILFINLGRSIKNRDNFINFPPTNSTEELVKYYSSADILLYPSIADNCPLAILEAMACGLPVVSFATGGIPELVKHQKTGYIANYKNANDLADGVKYLLDSNPALINKMRYDAIQMTKNSFTLEHMVDNYFAIYNKLI